VYLGIYSLAVPPRLIQAQDTVLV